MRTLALLFILVSGIATASSSNDAASLPDRLQSLAWLLGDWERVGLAEGRRGHERWRVDGGRYSGVGRTLEGTRVLFEETLRIELVDDELVYVAEVAGNARPVRFRCIEQSSGKVVFENPAHDFPKRIAYAVDGDRLEVRISGDSHERVFRFVRVAAPGAGSDPSGPSPPR